LFLQIFEQTVDNLGFVLTDLNKIIFLQTIIMSDSFNIENEDLNKNEQRILDINKSNKSSNTDENWSDVTKEYLDGLPKVWTRGMLYFLIVFVSIILPWTMLSKVDETGAARGRLEPKGKTIRLDASVSGTVAEIAVKEGSIVEKGQTLLLLESDLAKSELRQVREKLEGQLNRLSQLKSSQNQLLVALTTQQQHNQATELEKQAQIDQAKQNFDALNNSYNLQKEEKNTQVSQAKQALDYSRTATKLMNNSLSSARREEERYRGLLHQGAIPEINLVDKENLAKEKLNLYEQAKSNIEEGRLHLAEQQSSYERTLQKAHSDIEQAGLQLQEKQRSYQTLTRSSQLAVLKVKEQQKNLETEIIGLQAEIDQTKRQIESLQIQLSQRELKAPASGILFQLPIQKAGSVVQPGTMVAEIAPQESSLVIRAQIATTQSGFLRKDLPVKIKFDAYPFQDYGIVEGKVLSISPTTSYMDTPDGKVAAYNLEISLDRDCISSGEKCIPLRPGSTATAEIIVRQRRIIDFLLDPFKQLQSGGVKL
jgi:hemolysin D